MTRKPPFKNFEELGEERVRQALAAGNYGTTGSRSHDKVSGWLSLQDKEREDALKGRREARETESLSISRSALRTSRYALITAIAAIMFSVITAIVVALLVKK